MKDETQAKDEIIIVVKETIERSVFPMDLYGYTKIDNDAVYCISENIADRLYADGWRKSAEKDDKADGIEFCKINPPCARMGKEAQIDEMAKIIIKAAKSYYKTPVDIECANREASKLYDKGYRKQRETIREFMEKLNEADVRLRRKYGSGLSITSAKDVALKYGIATEDI